MNKSPGKQTALNHPPRLSKVKLVIDDIDWQAYEERARQVVSEAVRKYRDQFAGSPDEKVWQISLWTDVQTRVSAVNFETKSHAEDHKKRSIDWALKHGYDDLVDANREQCYNGNPADFKYGEYAVTEHPELEALQELDFNLTTHKRAAEARSAASLRRVTRCIRQENVLADLPHEDEVWIGISSPRDWYDHVQKIVLP